MNGVARQFWAEIFDIRTPLHDEDRERRSRSYRKTQRRVLTRRGGRREA